MSSYTPLTEEQLTILMKDLNPSRVSSRKQGGRSLSYLEAWDVKATLIRLFGFGGFSSEVIESSIIDISYPDPNSPKKASVSVKVTVRLYIPQLDATYTEVAASSQTGSQGVGDVADFAFKTAESDALKRCAIFLGTQFGLSLYKNGSTSEIIRTIVTPDQKFWNGQRVLPPVDEVRQGMAENDVANTTPEAEQDHPQFAQQEAQQEQAPQQGAQPLSGAPLTDDQKAANERIMQKLNQQVEGQ